LQASIERLKWLSFRSLKFGGISMSSENEITAVPAAEIFLNEAVSFLVEFLHDIGGTIVELD
jgi:hypothetical protein